MISPEASPKSTELRVRNTLSSSQQKKNSNNNTNGDPNPIRNNRSGRRISKRPIKGMKIARSSSWYDIDNYYDDDDDDDKNYARGRSRQRKQNTNDISAERNSILLVCLIGFVCLDLFLHYYNSGFNVHDSSSLSSYITMFDYIVPKYQNVRFLHQDEGSSSSSGTQKKNNDNNNDKKKNMNLGLIPVSKREKPLLIIHTGPHMTAMASLQSVLGDPKSHELLARDNFLYGGTCMNPHYQSKEYPCIKHDVDAFFRPDNKEQQQQQNANDQQKTRKLQPELKWFFDKMQRKQMNGLLVYQDASNAFPELMSVLNQHGYDFEITGTVFHRRMYETIPLSYSNQIISEWGDRPSQCDNLVPPTLESYLFFNKKEFRMTEQGNTKYQQKIPSECFNKLEKQWLNLYNFHKNGKHPVKTVLEKLSWNGEQYPTYMLDYPSDDIHKLVEELFCHPTTNTPNTCQRIQKEGGFPSINDNNIPLQKHQQQIQLPTMPVDYLRLMQTARQYEVITEEEYQHHLLLTKEPSKRIPVLVDKLENFVRVGMRQPAVMRVPLPANCMSRTSSEEEDDEEESTTTDNDKLDSLVDLSWNTESSLFPGRKSNKNERISHRQSFNEYMRLQNNETEPYRPYCSLDVDQMLNHTKWISAMKAIFLIPQKPTLGALRVNLKN